MPFISIRIIQTEVAPEFIQFTAGDTRTILCENVVELDAQILAGDINNHTFEWEQIDGTPVTLEDANTLTPWFINPNTTDFVFRLWIDRNTPFEKFSDVDIFRNPSSNASSTITVTGHPNIPTVLELGRNSSEVRIPSSVVVQPTSYLDQNGTFTDATCKNGPYAIIWTLPTGRTPYNILLGVEIQKLVSGTWVTDGTQPLDRRYWNIVNGVTYRLIMIWKDTLRNVISRETNNELYRAPDSKYTRNAFTSVANGGPSFSGSYNLTNFSTFVPTLAIFQVPDVSNTSAPSNSGTTQLTSFSTFIPGLIFLNEPETQATPAPSFSGTYDPDIFISRARGISIGEE